MCLLFIPGPTLFKDPESLVDRISLNSSSRPTKQGPFEKIWVFDIHGHNCESARLHIVNYKFVGGDYITVYGSDKQLRNKEGLEVFNAFGKYTSTGIYTHRVWAEKLVLEFHGYTLEGSQFVVDYVHYGDCQDPETPEERRSRRKAQESVCGGFTSDWRDVRCYRRDYPKIFDQRRSVMRLRLGGGGCTAWKIGDDDRFITNNHCIGNQATVDTAELDYLYDRLKCSGSRNREARTVFDGKDFIQTNSGLDFTIFTVKQNTAGIAPCLQPILNDPNVGSRMYLVHHPALDYKKISLHSDRIGDSGVCRVSRISSTRYYYYCDTTGGSSGSPVFEYGTRRVIALHCHGGCENWGNKMSRIVETAGPNMGVCSDAP